MLITEIIALICIVVGVVNIAGCLMLELWSRMAPLGGGAVDWRNSPIIHNTKDVHIHSGCQRL